MLLPRWVPQRSRLCLLKRRVKRRFRRVLLVTGRGEDIDIHIDIEEKIFTKQRVARISVFLIKDTVQQGCKEIYPFFREPEFWSVVYFDMCKGNVKTLVTGGSRKQDLGKCTDGVFGNKLEFVILRDTLFRYRQCPQTFAHMCFVYVYTYIYIHSPGN